jgi:hypothetical protein
MIVRSGRQLSAQMFKYFSIVVSRLLQQPHCHGPAAALPMFRYAHLFSRLNMAMHPTVKHPNPYLAISIAVFFGSSSSAFAPPPHRASWLRGFVAMHPHGSIP